MNDDATVTTGDLAKLFEVTPKTIADLAKREIIVTAGKRGRWQLQPSVSGYVYHLREEAAGRGGGARARLGQAQATLAEPRTSSSASGIDPARGGVMLTRGGFPALYARATLQFCLGALTASEVQS